VFPHTKAVSNNGWRKGGLFYPHSFSRRALSFSGWSVDDVLMKLLRIRFTFLQALTLLNLPVISMLCTLLCKPKMTRSYVELFGPSPICASLN
jgi:hypothetical protein